MHRFASETMYFDQDDRAFRAVTKFMTYTTIQLSFDSGVATITLNRPEKRNAVSFALVEELLGALDEIEQSSADVVILTGAGKAFCAGLDLDELRNLLGKTQDENVEESSRMG